MHNPTRRDILSVTASGLCVGLAGCNMTESAPKNDTNPDGGNANEPEDGEFEILPPDPVYVENFTAKELQFDIRILRLDEIGEREVFASRYQVGAEQGVRFPDVGVNGNTYRLEFAFDDQSPLTREWDVTECPPESRWAEASAVGVYVRDDEVGFAQNECDAIAVGDELTYLSPEEAAVDA